MRTTTTAAASGQSGSTLDPVLYQAIRKHRRLFVDIAVISCGLGILGGVCLVLLLLHWLAVFPLAAQWYSLVLYVLTGMVFFHFTEFLVAAWFRPHDTHPQAFMLYHSRAYSLASLATIAEFVVETWWISDQWKLWTTTHISATLCAAAVVLFYGVRVWGMVCCGENFSLMVETEKRTEHRLITDGIYRYLRHPAYFGWFWRVMATQLLLMNPVCLVAFAVVTWKFFADRIPFEEEMLSSEKFFGKQYRDYASRTGTGIPGIP